MVEGHQGDRWRNPSRPLKSYNCLIVPVRMLGNFELWRDVSVIYYSWTSKDYLMDLCNWRELLGGRRFGVWRES